MKSKILLTLALFACSNRSHQDVDCNQLSDEANKYFESYLFKRSNTDLELSNFYIKKALACDSLKPLNNWLRIKILSAKGDYDSVLNAINKFEKVYNGPDLKFTKGEVYEKLGQRDSSRVNFERAALIYDSLRRNDPTNSTYILAQIQVTLHLEGKERAHEKLKAYKEIYPHLVELESAERILFDSIK